VQRPTLQAAIRAEDGGRVVLENATDFEVRQFLSAIEKHVGSLRGERVLDFGCGNGVLLRIVSEMGAEAVGIEQSETAREHVANSGYGRAYADLGEFKKMQPSAEFDFIMMCDAVEHLREPWVDLAELRSVLAPRGRLFMTTPNTKSLRSRLSRASWDQRNNPTHFYYFNSQSLTKVVKRSGFSEVVELPPITEYRHHGLVRRALQHGLARFGLHGGLLFMASR
jgi:2-polyprenyl-3-methyl-5-hydroxy-6-metoxy-1,4-benzoquinol methylase